MPKPRVYFGKLPSDTSSFDIEKLVDGYGSIRDLATHGTYAFVEFDKMRDAEYAISRLHGVNFKGKKIIVELAKNGNRARSPIRRRSVSPSYPSRRRSRSRSNHRSWNRRRSPSRSRSPIFRYSGPRTPSPPPPPPIMRPRKLSLGSLEDGEIRSSSSLTSVVVDANVRKLEDLSDSDSDSSDSGQSSKLSIVKRNDDLLSESGTPMVSPRHTSPSDNDGTPAGSVKGSPLRGLGLSLSESEDEVEVARGGGDANVEDVQEDVDDGFLHDYFEDVGFDSGPMVPVKAVSPKKAVPENASTTPKLDVNSNVSSKTVDSDVKTSPSTFNDILPPPPTPPSHILPAAAQQPPPKPSSEYNLIQDLELSDSDSDLDTPDEPNQPQSEANPIHHPIPDGHESDSSSSSSSSSSSGSSSSDSHESDFE